MSDPVLQGYPFYYFTCDRDPTASEPLVFNDYSDFGFFWWNTISNDFFRCVDDTEDALVWNKTVTDVNILNVIKSQGWNINTSRSYSLRSSPAFNTPYTPSLTNDTLVVAVVSLASTILTAGTVLFQVDNVTISEASISGLAATEGSSMTCLVPANSSYQLVNSSGTSSIVSLNEISM